MKKRDSRLGKREAGSRKTGRSIVHNWPSEFCIGEEVEIKHYNRWVPAKLLRKRAFKPTWEATKCIYGEWTICSVVNEKRIRKL